MYPRVLWFSRASLSAPVASEQVGAEAAMHDAVLLMTDAGLTTTLPANIDFFILCVWQSWFRLARRCGMATKWQAEGAFRPHYTGFSSSFLSWPTNYDLR